jgi:hypothetical protein
VSKVVAVGVDLVEASVPRLEALEGVETPETCRGFRELLVSAVEPGRASASPDW